MSNRKLEFSWRNSEQLHGDLVEAVTALKNEPGDANIGMSGSISVVPAAGRRAPGRAALLVHPIAVRTGMRLFGEGDASIQLELLSSETFETGVLNLVYAPAESHGDAGFNEAEARLPQPES